MSRRGYGLEHEIEQYFLQYGDQTAQMPFEQRTFRVPFSGMMASLKGDVRTHISWLPKQFIIECKERKTVTKKKGQVFRLPKEWLLKLEEEAKIDDRIPILIFSFKGARNCRLNVIVNDSFINTFGVGFKNRLNSSKPYEFKKKCYIFVKDSFTEASIFDLDGYIVMSWKIFDFYLSEFKKKLNLGGNRCPS
jgi:hypothetical protein